jgi:hypothetical protein
VDILSKMPTILTSEQQEEFLKDTIQTVLDNFSLARLLTDLFIKYTAAGFQMPQASVCLRGQLPAATVNGENCGFFATPVIQMATLDCRRSLDFFGLTCNHTTNHLESITTPRRYSDDLGIENFGLPLVLPNQFLKIITPATVVSEIERHLVNVHKWSNKELAHFSFSRSGVSLQALHSASVVMVEAYLRFLFDALKIPRPDIQGLVT